MKKPLSIENKNDSSIRKPDLINELLGKFEKDLPPPNKSIIPRKIPIPIEQENCWYPENLVEICKFILKTPPLKMNKSPFIFSTSKEATFKNWETLKSFNFNLEAALSHNSPNQLSVGSEFKDVELLQLIFKNHPLWNKLKSHLSSGCNYPVSPIEDDKLMIDLDDALAFGNHKGAVNNPDLFQSMMDKEVEHGWALPIPREKIKDLGHKIILSPMNIIEQMTINEKGEKVPKKRITHNQSMVFGSESSINSRLISEELQDVMYGKCILRLIHDIIAKREANPSKRILIQKIDYKSAYRRGHLSANAALQSLTQCTERDLVFIFLRLTFGGAANPSLWGDFSESITDLSNALFESDWEFYLVKHFQYQTPVYSFCIHNLVDHGLKNYTPMN